MIANVKDYWQNTPIRGESGTRFVSGQYADYVDH
jgi:hypothetical protein